MNALTPWAADSRDEDTLKDAFAAELLRTPNDPFKAAQKIVGNTIRALQMSQDWPTDVYVLKRQVELIEEFGEDNFLPSKLTLARRIYELGETTTASISERLAAYRLYADLRNFIEKPSLINQNNLTVNNNKVMVVQDFGSDDQWEETAKNQQMKLVSDARN